MKKIALFMMAVVMLVACGEPNPASKDVKLTLKPGELSLKVGENSRVAVTAEPAGDYVYEWSTSDANIATVENGVVTGVALGEATISVKIKDSQSSASMKVKVMSEMGAVKYYGLGMFGGGEKDQIYEVQDQDGNKVQCCPIYFMMLPSNYLIDGGQLAGTMDYPMVFWVSCVVADDGLALYGTYTMSKNAVDLGDKGPKDDILFPYQIQAEAFMEQNYLTFCEEALINQNQDQNLMSKYPWFSSNFAAQMMKWDTDQQSPMLFAGYPMEGGEIFIFEQDPETYIFDLPYYNFDVTYYSNLDFYGLNLITKEDENGNTIVDEETGEPTMFFPTDEAGKPIIEMSAANTHHFEAGEKPQQEAKVAPMSFEVASKQAAINSLVYKPISYKFDARKINF